MWPKCAAVAIGLSALCLAPAASQAQTNPAASGHYLVRYMGEVSCGNWLHEPAGSDSLRDATLNWVLGYLSRAAVARGVNLLDTADQMAIADWMDTYCTQQPRSSVLTGASKLEKELVAGNGPKTANWQWP